MKLWIFQIDEHVVYSLMCMKCNMCTSLVPEHTSDKSLDSPFLPDLAFLTPVMFSHCKYLTPYSTLLPHPRAASWKERKESEVAQSCPTLCDPMDCGLSGSSIDGIFQARVLEWIAISFSRGSSWPRNQTQVSCIAGRHFTVWATREALKLIKISIKRNKNNKVCQN